MTIKSIRVDNLYSFDHIQIRKMSDITCLVGRNNVGKSNLLKLIRFFYQKLENQKVLPPPLNSNYTAQGSISITYDITRIHKIVSGGRASTPFFRHIYNTLFLNKNAGANHLSMNEVELTVTLLVRADGSTKWVYAQESFRAVVSYLYPFFEIETRHIDLHDWQQLWLLVSRLKSFNTRNLDTNEIVEYLNSRVSENSNAYSDYVKHIQSIMDTSHYSYSEKVLNLVKIGLEGAEFNIEGQKLEIQSDGTNSHRYLDLFLKLAITLTRRDYIQPNIFIDEPEIGMHPTAIDKLFDDVSELMDSFRKTKNEKEIGKYSTPYPRVIIATHSPTLVKSVIQNFSKDHQLIHLTKSDSGNTKIAYMNSQYADHRFLNILGENEAKLFFSEFILFVEGATEIELFNNRKLTSFFPQLRRVDVYATNSVMLGGISPEFSNASIPYLVLYDLDKFIDIDLSNKKLKIKGDAPVDFGKLAKKTKRSYYNSAQNRLYKYVRQYLSFNDSGVDIGQKSIAANDINGEIGFNLDGLVSILNGHILGHFSTYTTSTTIEGALINARSIKLIKRWIIYEISTRFTVKNSKNPNKMIAALYSKANQSDLASLSRTLHCLLDSSGNSCVTISPASEVKLDRLRASYFKLLSRYFRSNFDADEMLCALRLLFDGKSDSLIGWKNANKASLNPAFRSLIESLEKYLSPMDGLFNKTSGWVTRFLDYSIDELSSRTESEKFEDAFKRHFPELFDIIRRLQLG